MGDTLGVPPSPLTGDRTMLFRRKPSKTLDDAEADQPITPAEAKAMKNALDVERLRAIRRYINHNLQGSQYVAWICEGDSEATVLHICREYAAKGWNVRRSNEVVHIYAPDHSLPEHLIAKTREVV
jgi:hypothetical protein